MIAVGGGGVVNDMIQRGYNLDVEMQLMDDPYGTSINKNRSLAGNDYSFKTAEDLVRRLYAKNPAMFTDGFSINKISNYIQQAKKRDCCFRRDLTDKIIEIDFGFLCVFAAKIA